MVTPSDTIIAPIVAQLILVAQQIEGIGPCYATAPDGPPEDGGVLFPCKEWQVESMTNARLRLRLTFSIIQVFRRRRLDEALSDIQAYIPAWWTVLSAWSNQTLGGHAISLDIESGTISSMTHAGQVFLALTHTVRVLTEFAIPVG